MVLLNLTESGKRFASNCRAYDAPAARKKRRRLFLQQSGSMIDLFNGSEANLGVITEIELGLLKKPAGFFERNCFFKNELINSYEGEELVRVYRNGTPVSCWNLASKSCRRS